MPDRRCAISSVGSNSRLSIRVRVLDRGGPLQVLAGLNIAAILSPCLERPLPMLPIIYNPINHLVVGQLMGGMKSLPGYDARMVSKRLP